MAQEPFQVYAADHARLAMAVVAGLRAGDGDGPREPGLAEQLVASCQGSDTAIGVGGAWAPLVLGNGDLWRYDQAVGIWRRIPSHDVRREVMRLSSVAVTVTKTGKAAPLIITSALMEAVVKMVEVMAERVDFDEARPGIACANGFVDLTGDAVVLRKPRADDYARHVAGWTYEAAAPAPRWDAFLADVWQGAKDAVERQRFLECFLGACLAGQAWHHARAVILLGDGANGKSVLCDVVAGMFPPGSVCSVAPHAMAERFRATSLVGAKLNLVADMPVGELKESGSLKQIVAGDPIEIEKKFKDSFVFRPTCGHIFSTNRLPMATDHSRGFLRRWVVLKFGRNFEGSGINREQLVRSIAAETPAIVARCAEAYMRARGYVIPPSSEEEMDEWRLDNDQVLAFLDEHYERIPPPHTDDEHFPETIRAIYGLYRPWAINHGHRPCQIRTLSRRVGEIVPWKRTDQGRVFALRFSKRS